MQKRDDAIKRLKTEVDGLLLKSGGGFGSTKLRAANATAPASRGAGTDREKMGKLQESLTRAQDVAKKHRALRLLCACDTPRDMAPDITRNATPVGTHNVTPMHRCTQRCLRTPSVFRHLLSGTGVDCTCADGAGERLSDSEAQRLRAETELTDALKLIHGHEQQAETLGARVAQLTATARALKAKCTAADAAGEELRATVLRLQKQLGTHTHTYTHAQR